MTLTPTGPKRKYDHAENNQLSKRQKKDKVNHFATLPQEVFISLIISCILLQMITRQLRCLRL